MRNIKILFGLAVVLLGLNRSFAGSLTLTLLGAGPTGTVYMKAAPLGSYTGYDFYAGVLDWTDKGAKTPDYFTYCVDIASVISVNDSYKFNAESFTTLSANLSSTFNSYVTNGIDNLWVNNFSEFQATLSGTINATTNMEAAELQMAVWDIIYNGNTGTLYDGTKSTSPLYFYNANSGAELTNAMSLAMTAYNDPAPSGSTALTELSGLMALQATDGSQNQIYLGTTMNLGGTDVSLVPLPNVFASFLAMMGMSVLFGAALKSGKKSNRLTVTGM